MCQGDPRGAHVPSLILCGRGPAPSRSSAAQSRCHAGLRVQACAAALAGPCHTQRVWGLYLGGINQMEPWCPPRLERLCLSLACVELVSCWKSPR